MNEIDEDLVVIAVEAYFCGEHLISVEKEGNDFVVVTKPLPVLN